MKILNERPDNFDSAFHALMLGVEKDVGAPITSTDFLKEEGMSLHYLVKFLDGRKMLAIIFVYKLKEEYALRFKGKFING